MTVSGTQFCSIAYHADALAKAAHAAYWLEDLREGQAESHFRGQLAQVRDHLEKLVREFGYELLESEPEPEPIDPEIVAQRATSADLALIAAGRGHLVGGR